MPRRILVPLLLFATLPALMSCNGNTDPNRLAASGTIEATEIHIAAVQPGQIVTMIVDDGSAVKQGDLIAVQDHTAADLQLKEAEAAVAAGRSQLSLTERGARKEDVAQAEAAVSQARANQELAATELERARALVKGDAMTREQFDNTETRFRLAEAAYKQAAENLQKISHLARPEEVSVAQARVQQLEATRDRVREAQSDCYITSPANGIIQHRVLEQGEMATPGATVATLIDPSVVHLMLYIPEESLARVKVGEAVDVTVDGSKKTYRGKVTFISPEAEFTPKNIQTKDDRTKLVFRTRVEIANPTGDLKPGLPADAVILLK